MSREAAPTTPDASSAEPIDDEITLGDSHTPQPKPVFGEQVMSESQVRSVSGDIGRLLEKAKGVSHENGPRVPVDSDSAFQAAQELYQMKRAGLSIHNDKWRDYAAGVLGHEKIRQQMREQRSPQEFARYLGHLQYLGLVEEVAPEDREYMEAAVVEAFKKDNAFTLAPLLVLQKQLGLENPIPDWELVEVLQGGVQTILDYGYTEKIGKALAQLEYLGIPHGLTDAERMEALDDFERSTEKLKQNGQWASWLYAQNLLQRLGRKRTTPNESTRENISNHIGENLADSGSRHNWNQTLPLYVEAMKFQVITPGYADDTEVYDELTEDTSIETAQETKTWEEIADARIAENAASLGEQSDSGTPTEYKADETFTIGQEVPLYKEDDMAKLAEHAKTVAEYEAGGVVVDTGSEAFTTTEAAIQAALDAQWPQKDREAEWPPDVSPTAPDERGVRAYWNEKRQKYSFPEERINPDTGELLQLNPRTGNFEIITPTTEAQAKVMANHIWNQMNRHYPEIHQKNESVKRKWWQRLTEVFGREFVAAEADFEAAATTTAEDFANQTTASERGKKHQQALEDKGRGRQEEVEPKIGRTGVDRSIERVDPDLYPERVAELDAFEAAERAASSERLHQTEFAAETDEELLTQPRRGMKRKQPRGKRSQNETYGGKRQASQNRRESRQRRSARHTEGELPDDANIE